MHADNIALRILPFSSHFTLQTRETDNQMIKLIINFPFVMQNDCNLQTSQGYIIRKLRKAMRTSLAKCKLPKAILSAFYIISQRKFEILLIL
jgi:hypothetical protein